MSSKIRALLTGLGVRRPAARTPAGRAYRALAVLAAGFAALHAFPQVLFAHSMTAHGITVHTTSPPPAEAERVVARAASLVARSPLALPGRREDVFVPDHPFVTRLFGPLSGGFAFSVAATGKVFVASGDLARDVARMPDGKPQSRSLSSVMAHEITHGLIRKRLGIIGSLRLPKWVSEGYCEHVARESSFPESEGDRLISLGRSDPSISFQYFMYRRMVDYLIEDRAMTFDEIAAAAIRSDALEREVREALPNRKRAT
jgi:hypothetical protein